MSTILEQKRVRNTSGRRSAAGRSRKATTPVEQNQGTSKRSLLRRWMAAGLIVGTAGLAVLFVANAIKVNQLLGSITSVEEEIEAIERSNEQLRAEFLRLMSAEQVTKRAEEFGMVHPETPPAPLPVKSGVLEMETTNKE